jgi:membrane fusion protein, multidrug efflux system
MVLKFTENYFALAALLIVTACGKTNQTPATPPPAQVGIQKVSEINVVFYDEYPATVNALEEVELRAQINGYITGIYFKDGDKVKKGERLYSIDQQQYAATYQQAVANLAVQEANLTRAQMDVERYRQLSKNDAIAKQQVDNAEANYTAAQKQVEASKAIVQSVQTNVRYATIVAPFDGTIGISMVQSGAAVSAGQTLLNTVSSDDPMAVDIAVDQKEIFRFTQLQANGKKAKASDSTFRLAFGGLVYPQAGKISVIDRAVDPQTGTLKMRLVFPNPHHELRSGMNGTLKVLSSSSADVLMVPFKAVTEQLGEFFVYVIDKDNRATQRKVALGRQIGKNVVIQEGLKSGESIAVEGAQSLREGSTVTELKSEEKNKNQINSLQTK